MAEFAAGTGAGVTAAIGIGAGETAVTGTSFAGFAGFAAFDNTAVTPAAAAQTREAEQLRPARR